MQRDRISETIEAIDRALEQPPVSIEEALYDAVQKNRMTAEEADQCYAAYMRTFNASDT